MPINWAPATNRNWPDTTVEKRQRLPRSLPLLDVGPVAFQPAAIRIARPLALNPHFDRSNSPS